MAELKRAGNKMEDQGIPRAALSEGVLTIDVDSHVETMEEQEDARWHQLLNAQKTGIVKWFSARRGYGFITDEKGNDFFVHFSEIQTEGFRKLKTGQAVTFQTEEDEQGRLLAKEVYPADPEKETGPKEELV